MISLLERFFRKDDRNLSDRMQRHLRFKKRFDAGIAIDDADFVAFDSELTGRDFKRDSLISLGAVKLKGRTILPAKTFYRLVKPDSELTSQSVVIHEIMPSVLKDADELADVIEDFIDFIGDAVLVGHFVHIDVNFVNKAMKKLYGRKLQNPSVDTASLQDWLYENDSRFARHYGGMMATSDLFSMAQKYDIPITKAHNAFCDAFITAQLFQRFLNFLPECGINTVKELLMIGKYIKGGDNTLLG